MIVYVEAQAADIEAIQTTAAVSWRMAYRAIFPPEFIDQFLAQAYSSENLLRALQNPKSIFLLAKQDEQVAGFWHSGNGYYGAQLFRLYVVPDYWRNRIGSELLRRAEERLAAQGTSSYYCYVHARNDIGQAFYANQGFVRDSARDRDDEWCLIKMLPQRIAPKETGS
ncbi:MAG: GNAT family N-acetyltransferase [Chloroflexales bacterium]|nr:GNAT family N-acetyltransferase [Chloroflexales bacterium]